MPSRKQFLQASKSEVGADVQSLVDIGSLFGYTCALVGDGVSVAKVCYARKLGRLRQHPDERSHGSNSSLEQSLVHVHHRNLMKCLLLLISIKSMYTLNFIQELIQLTSCNDYSDLLLTFEVWVGILNCPRFLHWYLFQSLKRSVLLLCEIQ